MNPDPIREATLAMRAWHRPGLCFVRRRAAPKRFGAEQEAALRTSFRKRIEALTGREMAVDDEALLPEATPIATADQQLATSIRHLLLTADLPLFLALSDATLVVARPEAVGALPGETLVLLGPDGKRKTGAAVDLLDDAVVYAAVEPWLGGRDALLARSAALGPAATAAAVGADLEAAAGGDPAALGKHWARALPMLRVLLAEAKEPERARMAVAIRAAAEVYDPLRSGVAPIGAAMEWRNQPGDFCRGCGMGYVEYAVRRVMRLLD